MAGKTEWEDMLIKLGHMEAPPQEPKVDLYRLDTPEIDPKQEKLLNATLDELDEFEDDEDDKILEEYRKKRLAEMQAAASVNKFGTVVNISEPEWKGTVTNAPSDLYVVVNLYKQGIPHSILLDRYMEKMAAKFKAVKFVRIRADEAIHGYPDRNIPTVLVYHGGDVVGQMVTLAPLGGDSATPDDVEWFLAKSGAVETELEENPKIIRDSRTKVNFMSSSASKKRDSDSDYSDDDDD
eukprot:TRINITY_DN3384_c0_g2_i1.p1 TRINITY_DN3384_c0_g2~~TRINITY_DN3384_c0_g2_i1.p1  ORF type:complete len:238 (+),score=81.39 TRINITY_DN3384_c0_g2_i1:82-795(+)